MTALLVSMTDTPGLPSLPNAALEDEAVESVLKDTMDCQVLHHPDSVTVKDRLKESSVVLFACHSYANPKDPSLSSIMLKDCEVQPARFSVRTILGMKLERCELAYLSSCESGASKDLLLRDEGINLAGGFHMTGIPHTVSTMWQVADHVSREITVEFFREIKDERGQVDVLCARMLFILVFSIREIRAFIPCYGVHLSTRATDHQSSKGSRSGSVACAS